MTKMENYVQKVRWEKNWSQGQLARISKVSQSTICDIENGNRIPNLETALKLSKALSQSVDSLFKLTT